MSICIYIQINLHAYTKVYYANIYYKYIILNDIIYIISICIYIYTLKKKTRLNVFDGRDTLVRLTISNHTKKKWGHPTHPSYIL